MPPLLVLVAAAALVSCGAAPAAGAPFGVHLAFGGSPSSMTLSWLDTTPQAPPGPVRYGRNASALDGKAVAAPALAAGNRTWAFHAPLGGLAPGQVYYYRVPGWPAGAAPRQFRAQPSAAGVAAAGGGFTVAVIGDMGIQGSEDTRKGLLSRLHEYDWVAHVGDYAYADELGRDYEQSWDEFFRQVEGVADSKAYATLPGNHDVACHDFGSWFCPQMFDNATVYRSRFRPPYAESGSPTSMWYSFDYGNAHFVFIDTETSYPGSPEGEDTMYRAGPFGDQLAWLDADLARANLPENRARRPWLIVAGHRPLYSSELVDFPLDAQATLRRSFEQRFVRARVDLYLTAHVHAFEANYPVVNGTVVQRGFDRPGVPVSVVNGAAGNIEGHDSSWQPAAKTPWLAYRNDKDYGYAMMTVHNDTALTYDFFAASTGKRAYGFTLTR